MDNPFDSPRLVIEEAKEHIARVKEGVDAFLRQPGITIGTEIEQKTGDYLAFCQYPRDIPARISMDVRAAARELRDALDHAVYASSVTLLGREPKKTKFLVAPNAEGITKEIKSGKCKDVHADIIAFMIEEGAHKAGNMTLWTLNELRNRNTHKVVTLANMTADGFFIGSGVIEGGTMSSINDWRSTRRRLYFGRFSADMNFNFQVRPVAQIGLQTNFGLPGVPVTSFLESAVADVERITARIESLTSGISIQAG